MTLWRNRKHTVWIDNGYFYIFDAIKTVVIRKPKNPGPTSR